MSSPVENLADLPLDSAVRVDATCDRFEEAHRSGSQPRIEDFLAASSEPEQRVLFRELLRLEIQLRLKNSRGMTLVLDDYRSRFPDLVADVDVVLRAVLPQYSSGAVNPPPNSGSAESLVGMNWKALKLPCQLGGYQLEEQIGHGGMGTVYRAVNLAMDRVEAIKLMLTDREPRADSVLRFKQEIRAVAKLRPHPNIVMAYNAGEARGLQYLAMEFVSGWDFANIGQCCGTLPIPVACECIRQAALGLDQVHEHGMVHRDIKPSNLMLTKEGVVKLLDLGLARLREGQLEEQLTRESVPMGTVEYMAPEQADNPHAVDIRADLYSLGCSLFKLLCGTSPFGQTTKSVVQILKAHANIKPPRVRDHRPEVPIELDELVDQLLRKPPSDRPQTPREVLIALEPFASQSALLAFASDLLAISSPDGHLPKDAPPGIKTETAALGELDSTRDDPTPPVTGDEINADRQEHRTSGKRTRRLAFGSTAIALAVLVWSLWPPSATTDLLRNLDLNRSLIAGAWEHPGRELLSPATGDAWLRLVENTPSEFRLEMTLAQIEGGTRYAIVHSGQPTFAIVFAPMLQIASDDAVTNSRDDAANHTWSGDWGDFADPAPRRFVLTVKDRRLLLERDGAKILEAEIPSEGTVADSTIPANVFQRPGIYLGTKQSQFRFSQVKWTPLSVAKGP